MAKALSLTEEFDSLYTKIRKEKEGGAMENRWMNELKYSVLDSLKNEDARIYFFGSRARGEGRKSSDVDLAVDSGGRDISFTLALLRERLEESSCPYRVDVVDMNRAGEPLRRRIKKEGILWKDFRNGLH